MELIFRETQATLVLYGGALGKNGTCVKEVRLESRGRSGPKQLQVLHRGVQVLH